MRKIKNSQTVSVHVFAYRKAEGLPVQVGVKPDVLDLSEYAKCDLTLQWRIVTKGYRFPLDGSAIVFTSPGSKKVFSATKVDKEGQIASVHIEAITGLAYAYTVSVIDDSTGLTTVLDPVVIHPTD